MSVTWELGITSATAVTLNVLHSHKRRKRQIRNAHRARAGGHYLYKWGDFEKFRVPVEFLSPANAGIVNSWWDTNTQLILFITSGGSTQVNSVMIMNDESPLQQMQKPWFEHFKGVIDLEGY